MPSRLQPPPPLRHIDILVVEALPRPLIRSTSLSPLQPPPTPPLPRQNRRISSSRLLPPLAGATVALSLSLFFLFFFRRLIRRRRRRRRTPISSPDPNLPRRFSYSLLRRATSSFSPSRRLGQGGFGAVFSGTLTLPVPTITPKTQDNNNINKKKHKIDVAVKLMDSGSLQGEREFHNEILMAEKLLTSDRVVRLLGFASDRKRRQMCLVYELMSKGNLQDCLLRRGEDGRPPLEDIAKWPRRLRIAIEVAEGIAYLHHSCDPPIIHGDIKPSNVLLDHNLSAKIGDFGLARFKLVDRSDAGPKPGGSTSSKREDSRICAFEDNGSVAETDSVTTTTVGFDEASVIVDLSPDNFLRAPAPETSPEMFTAAASPLDGVDTETGVVVEGVAVEDHGELVVVKSQKGGATLPTKDWLLKQGTGINDRLSNTTGKVKDYVIEWIGTEISNKDRPHNSACTETASCSSSVAMVKLENEQNEEKKKKQKKKKRLDWWVSMEDDSSINEKKKPVRAWWREEYCEELERKKKAKKKSKKKDVVTDDYNQDNWWPRDDGLYSDKKMKNKSRSRKSSRSSIDWWLDGFSGDLWKVQHSTYDTMSGEIPKSGGISSTPSMRGTVCYMAPEYSGGDDLSEKCDVYSYGVLLLVLISGRRPLQVTGSPISEYQSANLITWSRRLARCGKLLDLVDKKVESLNSKEAQLCIIVALLCLQKSPARRPSMKEVVGMLTGELDPPHLPVELSPSPPCRFPYKSHKKAR